MAIVSFIFSLISGEPVVGAVMLLFYYLGGVGVRERSRYAAAIILSLYVADTLASGLSVVRVIFAALLISNLRATWIASTWKPDSEEAILPTRLNQTWGDKFSDQFPSWLWPKVRAAYYVFSVCVVILFAIGITMLIRRSTH